jgi:hypothetical protein
LLQFTSIEGVVSKRSARDISWGTPASWLRFRKPAAPAVERREAVEDGV